MSKIGIIGGGAWGTALAMVMRRADNEVIVYAHELGTVTSINYEHVNKSFLPEMKLDPAIRATSEISEAIDVDAVLLVTPSQHLRAICENASDTWRSDVPAVICTKGIERGTCALMSEVVAATLPKAPLAVLTGPTFAGEVARELPTAVTLACNDETLGKILLELMSARCFRIYRSRDVTGAQIGGTLKNVVAIACGIVEGRGLGQNARAAIITRGLAEMIRFGVAKGARPETLSGLTGVGDLTLTCSTKQSRNFSLGFLLGSGKTLTEILKDRVSVAEGVDSASSVTELARRIGVETPICEAVDKIINHDANIDNIIGRLLSRPLKEEMP